MIRLLASIMLVALGTGTAFAAPGYVQDFETDIAGWDAFGGAFDATRVASGTDGIPSAGGAFHAVSSLDGSASNLGGYSCCFPPGGYEVSLDIYLDFTWADGSDKRFNVTHAINGQPDVEPDDCSHYVDFVVAIGTRPGVPGEYIASLSQNCPGWPSDPGREPQAITSGTGWYNLKYILRDEGGFLALDVELRDPSSTLVGFWDFTPGDPNNANNPIPITTVSGNRYLWFCASGPGGGYSNLDVVAFDNVVQGGQFCQPVANESKTWGAVKGLFQ